MCITVWSVNYNILEFSLVKQMFCNLWTVRIVSKKLGGSLKGVKFYFYCLRVCPHMIDYPSDSSVDLCKNINLKY